MLKSVTHQDKAVFYEDTGAGEPVVLIHGFSEDRRIWKPVIDAVTASHRLILPDLPGSGASPLHDNLSIESMAEAMHAILRQEQLANAVVIGHSMGGYVSLALAERHPEVISALGLFHSTAFPDNPEKVTARRKNIQFIQAHGSREFIKQSLPGLFGEDYKTKEPERIRQLVDRYAVFDPAALVAYQGAMIRRPDRTDVLKNASVPVLFVIGKQDNAIPFADSMRLCHLPALSYIHILERSGHMGMLEATDLCNQLLGRFLKDLDVTFEQPIK